MISRRQALTGIGGGLLAGALSVTPAGKAFAVLSKQGGYPWEPRKIDPDEAAAMGYDGFYDGGQGCCYGVFTGIVGQMAKKYGAPYNTFPLGMMAYGASGVANWGTLCGSLNGAAAAFGLFFDRKNQEPLVDSLFYWYEKANLPEYIPDKPEYEYDVPKTISSSVLCHASVSKWCYRSGTEMHSPERSERCARVTADTARQAAILINLAIDNKPISSSHNLARSLCGKCHSKDGDSDIMKGKMGCRPCHDGSLTTKFKDHP